MGAIWLHHHLAHMALAQVQPEVDRAGVLGGAGKGDAPRGCGPAQIGIGRLITRQLNGPLYLGGAGQLNFIGQNGDILAVLSNAGRLVASARKAGIIPQGHLAGRHQRGIGIGVVGVFMGLDAGVVFDYKVGEHVHRILVHRHV